MGQFKRSVGLSASGVSDQKGEAEEQSGGVAVLRSRPGSPSPEQSLPLPHQHLPFGR